jgi:hypothetical protein
MTVEAGSNAGRGEFRAPELYKSHAAAGKLDKCFTPTVDGQMAS